MLREGFANNAIRGGWWWWWAPPGFCVALLGTGLALLNFGIDEYVNPRLRVSGLSRRVAEKAGISTRAILGMTPVVSSVRLSDREPSSLPHSQPLPTAVAARPGSTSPQVGRDGPEPVLEIHGLSVDYGYGDQAVHAVVDCDLVLRRGRVLGLAGESGSGKTTLALAAIRLLRSPALITAGSVLFHSKPISGGPSGTVDLLAADEDELRAVRWSEISVVLQSSMNALNPVITVGAQFDDLLRVHRPRLTRPARRDRSGELLDMVGINADRLRSYPHELSGGMRQRAMIAMALALEPQVMILDEPTTALDVVTQREILEELIALRDRLGFAALFITHDLSLLVELADEIAVMYAGRLMEKAPAASLFNAPRLPYTHGLIHCFPPMHGTRGRMNGIPGSPPDLRDLPTGCAFHPRCAWAMEQCRQEAPRLEPLPGSEREVACWLHRGDATVPAELGRPEPGAAQGHGPLARRVPVHAVDKVSVRLEAGKVTAVVGESGAGKTTVARLLARIIKPDAGQVLLDGRPAPSGRPRSYAAQVQMVFQDPFASLNPVHRARHLLVPPLQIHPLADRHVDLVVSALLRRVALNPPANFTDKFPHELSGGQRQRVAIARALAV